MTFTPAVDGHSGMQGFSQIWHDRCHAPLPPPGPARTVDATGYIQTPAPRGGAEPGKGVSELAKASTLLEAAAAILDRLSDVDSLPFQVGTGMEVYEASCAVHKALLALTEVVT